MSTVSPYHLELDPEEFELCGRSEAVQTVLEDRGRARLAQQPDGTRRLLANSPGLELLLEAFAAEANQNTGAHEAIFAGLFRRALATLESLTLEELNSEEPLQE